MKLKTLASSFLILVCSYSNGALAADKTPAFKVYSKVSSVGEVAKEDQSTFYDIEKKKYELIEQRAQDKFLQAYWQKLAKSTGKSVSAAKKAYMAKHVKTSEKEVKQTMERFKDHPQLSKLSKKEQEKQVRDYIKDRDTGEVIRRIIAEAKKKKELVILYPKPEEPIYKVVVTKDDHVRYGPNSTDTKALGCDGNACPITIVEYSEFQCPFCSRVLPDVKRVLTEYKGKVRWIVRDFPLSFHDRARPAAIAAKCAAFQDKYWEMYSVLFKNQRALDDADLDKYATEIGLDKKKYKLCVKSPVRAESLIETNFKSGAKLGVTGTPAFFINGRRLSGALPFAEFKRVIDSELTKKKG